MVSKSYIDVSAFSAFEREEIRRNIVKQGRDQGLTVKINPEGNGAICVSIDGNRLHVVAYEAAVLHWFQTRPDALRP